MSPDTTSTQAGAAPSDIRIDRLSPDALVASFAQSHLLKWFLAALAAHAVVIGGFSIGNIRDMLDPEAAAARKAAAVAAAKAPPAAAATATETSAPPSPQADATKPAEGSASQATGKTPIEKATSEVAKPEEIPAVPDDLGLSIEDTNPN